MSDQPPLGVDPDVAVSTIASGELLWEFGWNHFTWSSELRDAFGVEAQILCELELVMRRRVRVRVSPVRWADDKRGASARGEGPAGTFWL